MTQTDAQRKAKNKWDKQNMTSLSVKIKKEYAELIKAACAEDSTTVSDLFYNALSTYMEKRGTPLPTRKQAQAKKT